MKVHCCLFVVLALVGACNRQGQKEGEAFASKNQQPNANAPRQEQVPAEMKEKIVGQALAVVRERGRSIDAMDIAVSNWRESYMIWFTPRDRRSGDPGFVVKIEKDGKTQPRILNVQ